jgi:Flp pilus assembly protein TadG
LPLGRLRHPLLGGRRRRGDAADRSLARQGQSLVEFAIVLPILLAFVVLLVDVTRLYQQWITFESATRDAAQYLATSSADPCDDNYSGSAPTGECTIPATADQKAKYLLDAATGANFTINAGQTSCTTPMVSTSYTEDSAVSSGGSGAYPVGAAIVTACLPFRTVIGYPLVTQDGMFTLRAERAFRSLVGR